MTVTFRSSGTVPTGVGAGTGSTSVTPGMPAGIVAGDLLVMFAGTKPDTAVIQTPVGWTDYPYGNVAGGAGAGQAADTGDSRLAVFTKQAVGGDTVTVSITSGNASWAMVICYTSSDGANAVWDCAATGGVESTSGTTWAATCANPKFPLKVGDYPVIFGIQTGTDGAGGWSSETVTATGATIGSGSEIGEPVTTTGNDCGGVIGDIVMQGGAATAAPVINATCTTGTNAVGPSVVLTVRDNQLIVNPGFEVNTANWVTTASYWVNSGATLTRTVLDAHSGSACGDVVYDVTTANRGITYSGTFVIASTIRDLSPKSIYHASAWVRVKSGRPVSLNIRDGTNGIDASSVSTSADAWTLLDVTLKTGATNLTGNSVTLSICSDGTVGVGEFYVDDIRLGLVASPPPVPGRLNQAVKRAVNY